MHISVAGLTGFNDNSGEFTEGQDSGGGTHHHFYGVLEPSRPVLASHHPCRYAIFAIRLILSDGSDNFAKDAMALGRLSLVPSQFPMAWLQMRSSIYLFIYRSS